MIRIAIRRIEHLSSDLLDLLCTWWEETDKSSFHPVVCSGEWCSARSSTTFSPSASFRWKTKPMYPLGFHLKDRSHWPSTTRLRWTFLQKAFLKQFRLAMTFRCWRSHYRTLQVSCRAFWTLPLWPSTTRSTFPFSAIPVARIFPSSIRHRVPGSVISLSRFWMVCS